MSIAYDQIQDVGDYVEEQRGGAKQKGELRLVHCTCCARCGTASATSTSTSASRCPVRSALGPPADPGTEPHPDEDSIALQKLASRSRCASTA